MAGETAPIDHEQQIRDLAARKGYVLRRAEEGKDRWHLMNPAISSAIYSVSLGNPHSYTLEEAERILRARRDVSSPSPPQASTPDHRH